MVNIFNRKEILITRDQNEYFRVCNLLDDNRIEHKTGMVSLLSAGRHRGMPGINQEFVYDYKIYVHKNDYDKAKELIAK